MKYAIYDFSQAELVKYNDNHPKDKLDMNDLMIFRWFTHFAAVPRTEKKTAMWRKLFDGEVYYWINYQALIEEFPLFDISTKKGIAKRFDKYVSGGLMKKKVYKARSKGSLTFFAFTSEFSKLEYNEENSSQKINPHKALESDQNAVFESEADTLISETDGLQKDDDTIIEENNDFREELQLLSNDLEKNSGSSLNNTEEVREELQLLSNDLEKNSGSSLLNNTLTKLNTKTTAVDNKTDSNPENKTAAVSFLHEIINKVLGDGSDQLFSDDFYTDIVSNSGLEESEYEDFIKYAYKKTKENRNIQDFSKYFYKTVTKKYFVINYWAYKKQEALSSKNNAPGGPSAAKDSAPRPGIKCPVCGVMHDYSAPCPNCGLPADSDRETVEMHKIRFQRGESVYKKLTAELASRKQAVMPVFDLTKAAVWNRERTRIIEKYQLEDK